ncbi:MAG: hypothetical protein AAFY88_04395 [Acidobacteriota bacterium]
MNLRASLTQAGDILVREGGEIQVMLDQTHHRRDGIYRLSLSFRSQADFDRALAEGLESVQLDALDYLAWIGSDGPIVRDGDGVSILDAAGSARGSLCGQVVARGQTWLDGGLWVGVSVHAVPQTATEKRLPGDGGGGGALVHRDIFNDCAFSSWPNGCSGEFCTNLRDEGFGALITEGNCVEGSDIPGFSFCLCKDQFD